MVKLVKLLLLLLCLIALCDNGLDILVEEEIDLREIWLDEQDKGGTKGGECEK